MCRQYLVSGGVRQTNRSEGRSEDFMHPLSRSLHILPLCFSLASLVAMVTCYGDGRTSQTLSTFIVQHRHTYV